MRVPFLEDGIIAQFEDYDRLEELDWDAYRARYGDIQRLDRILEAEGDTINRYKASKQADVLMLFYLFSSTELRDLLGSMGYEFDPESIPRNIDYYMRRTSHGSTLSRVVHSWVLARSDRARSWELLTEALESDLLDIQGGTTAEGIHLGAMAGSVDLIQRGQTALEFTDHTLSHQPLPAGGDAGPAPEVPLPRLLAAPRRQLRRGDGLRPAWLGRPAADPGARPGARLRARRAADLHLPSGGGLAAPVRAAEAREGGPVLATSGADAGTGAGT